MRQTTDEPTEAMTSDDVRETYSDLMPVLEDQTGMTPFRALFEPSTRAAILDVLVETDEALTMSEIADRADISVKSLYNHLGGDAFLHDAGVVVQAGKRGNAQTFRANHAHPVVQLLSMARTVQRHGVTPDRLDEQFVGDPGADYEPGEHPDDPR